jgi:hypothetical protein
LTTSQEAKAGDFVIRLAGGLMALYALCHAYRQVRWERMVKRIFSLWRKESYRLADGWSYRADWVKR